jgi:hypothetical protein
MPDTKRKTEEEISAMDPNQRVRYQRKRRHRDAAIRKQEAKREKILADWHLHGDKGTCSQCQKRGTECIPPPAENMLRTKCESCSKRGRECSIGEVLFNEDYIPVATRIALGVPSPGPRAEVNTPGQTQEAQVPREDPGHSRGSNNRENEITHKESRILQRHLRKTTSILRSFDEDVAAVSTQNTPNAMRRLKRRYVLHKTTITKFREALDQVNKDLDQLI